MYFDIKLYPFIKGATRASSINPLTDTNPLTIERPISDGDLPPNF